MNFLKFATFSTEKLSTTASTKSKRHSPVQQARITVNGKAAPNAKPGQTILTVARQVGVEIPTYCKRGACGTCACYMNYHKVHACKETIPAQGRVEIQTLD